MNLEEEINDLLFKYFGREEFNAGLERISKSLAGEIEIIKLAQKENKLKIITIAGTNGKGETTYELEAILRKNEKRVARWISPHILSISERINFNGEDISLKELKTAILEGLGDVQKYSYQLSYYEFLFFIFCRLIVKNISTLDCLILEVGLGGRLDAVNIFDADCVGLTSISRDHENILGIGYSNILSEKMGVTRPFGILISSLELSYLREQISTHYQVNCFDLFSLGITKIKDDFTTRNKKLAMALFICVNNQCHMDEKLFLSELGNHLEKMDFTPKGFKGRFEKVTWEDRCFIFIGAHNIDGIRKMANHPIILKSRIDYIWCSFSKRLKKEMINSLSVFMGLAPTIVTPFTHFKASSALELQEVCADIKNDQIKYPLFFEDDIFATLSLFEKNKTIVVTGSYYFIGEVQKIISVGAYPYLHSPDSKVALCPGQSEL